MWKKEITDTLKQTALVLSFLLLMPIIFGINQMRFSGESLSFSWYIDWGMSFLLPILMLYLSYMMFASEDSDGATEYLKSLPVNKWKLLTIKILPRFAVIVVIAFVYHSIFRSDFVHSGRFFYFYYSPGSLSLLKSLTLIITPLFFGFMLGISSRSNVFLALAFLLTVSYFVFAGYNFMSLLSRHFYRLWWSVFHNTIPSFFVLDSVLRIFLPTLLPVLVLIPVFKSWDVSSGTIRSQIMLKRMAVPIALIIALFAFDHLSLLYYFRKVTTL